jgi:cold shock CspA family protein
VGSSAGTGAPTSSSTTPAIQGEGYRNVEEGQTVELDIGVGRKGDEAQNVRAL